MKAEVKEQVLGYRKEHFAVEIAPCKNPMERGEIVLSITKNGFQWERISLLPSERKLVLKALRTGKKSGKGTVNKTRRICQMGCPHCEKVREHEYLRTLPGGEIGHPDEVWKCLSCGRKEMYSGGSSDR